MSKILALDWDRHQLRYVLALTGRKSVKVLAAAAVPMAMTQDEDDERERPDPAGTLRSHLGRSSARLPALVGVDRASIETLPLTLPPATDAELPELVLNQAMRESPTVTEDTALDFLPLTNDPAEPREVLAASVAPEAMGEIRKACIEAGLKPARMLMRPYSSASLFLRSQAAPDGRPTLLVNQAGDEVDLTVLAGGKIIFTRTSRIPHSDDQAETDRRVAAEVGRTLMVAMQHQIGDRPVEQVCLLATEGERPGLIEAITQQFDLPTVELNPFDTVDVARKVALDEAGPFAALLGMLVDEAHGARHAIDFLHPREIPKAPNRIRLYVAVAAFLAIGTGFFWNQQSAELEKLDGTVTALIKQRDEQKALATRAAAQMRVVNSVKAWQAAEINWLDELRDLSVRFPSGDDMVLMRMSLAPGRGGGGAVTFNGLARDPKIIVQMEKDIRDGYHDIRSKRMQERGPGGELAWSFETSVSVAPRDRARYVARLQQEAIKAQQVAQGPDAAQAAPQQGGRP